MVEGGKNQKLLLLLHRSIPVQAMSAINRLLFALGWMSPPEQRFLLGGTSASEAD